MNVLLVRPNYESHIITPPLGMGYLASYLKKNGITVNIIDGLRDRLDNREIVRRILKNPPDIVGITCLTAFYNEVVDLATALKKQQIRVAVGGVHPTFLPYTTLRDTQADYVICGEGEKALAELVARNFNHAGIKGIYTLADLESDIAGHQKADPVISLDEIPFPDWEQMPPNLYRYAPHGVFVKNFPIGVMMTTRGCPYECTFCASPRFYERKIRYRSPQNVVDEIAYLVKRFGVKEIHFEDDNLTFNRNHINEICELLIEKKLHISWACPNGIRADKVDEELMKLMAKSGCYALAYGVESANQKILQNVKKYESIETIEKSISLAHRHGISCLGFFIFGLPGETSSTMEETIAFAKRTKLNRAQFSILDIIPGSQLWFDLKGKFTARWGKSSFRDPEWIPQGLTREQIIAAQVKALRGFYGRWHIFLRLLFSLRVNQVRFFLQRLKEYRLVKLRK